MKPILINLCEDLSELIRLLGKDPEMSFLFLKILIISSLHFDKPLLFE
jgi:hypothetical protein